jgi:hypothetical protein
MLLHMRRLPIIADLCRSGRPASGLTCHEMQATNDSNNRHPVDKSQPRPLLLAGLLLVFTQLAIHADTIINFDDLNDSDVVTTQYAGLTFTNAIILTAGISLNEFEFPPHSGTNVVSDDGGFMTIAFSTPVTSVSGYFTYLEPLTLTAFDSSSSQLRQTFSAFSSNLALSGDPGSRPNELLALNFPTGISSVIIAGDPAGGSFVIDDLTYSPLAPAAPEPTSILLFLTGATILAATRLKRTL